MRTNLWVKFETNWLVCQRTPLPRATGPDRGDCWPWSWGSSSPPASRFAGSLSRPCGWRFGLGGLDRDRYCRRAGIWLRNSAVSRGVVVDSYAQLAAEGYLSARRGSGTRVAFLPEAAGPPVRRQLRPPAQFRYDLRPGQADFHAFPRDRWKAALARALRELPDTRLTYPDSRGVPELRNAVAEYLARVRGVVVEPEHVIVCCSASHALTVLWRALRHQGARRAAVEDPGWTAQRRTVEQAGLEAIPVRVDTEGLVISELAAADVDAVVLTPAHHYPTGVVMTAERRGALIAWARQRRALIVEDDYDVEYRFGRDPVASLQGLAPDLVTFVGTTSKTLAPALRLAWMVPPAHLIDDIADELDVTGAAPPTLDQIAMASFMQDAGLERHLRSMRRRYRAKRDVFIDALGQAPPRGPRERHRRRTASLRVASRHDRRAKNGGAGPALRGRRARTAPPLHRPSAVTTSASARLRAPHRVRAVSSYDAARRRHGGQRPESGVTAPHPASPRPGLPASSRPRVPASRLPRFPASPRPRVPASPLPRFLASPRPRVPASRLPRPPAYREHFQGYPLKMLPIGNRAAAGAPPAAQQTQHGSAVPDPARRQHPHPAPIRAVLAATTPYTGNPSAVGSHRIPIRLKMLPTEARSAAASPHAWGGLRGHPELLRILARYDLTEPGE